MTHTNKALEACVKDAKKKLEAQERVARSRLTLDDYISEQRKNFMNGESSNERPCNTEA